MGSNNNQLLGCLVTGLICLSLMYVASSFFNIYTKKLETDRLSESTVPFSRSLASAEVEILILGDSLAYGVGSSSPDASFAGRIGQLYPTASIVNKAVIGDAISDMAGSLETLIDKKYSAIFVIIGGNDVVRPSVTLDESVANLDYIYERVEEQSDKAYFYTTSNFNNVEVAPAVYRSYYNNRARFLRDHSVLLAEKYPDIKYVDVFGIEEEEYSSYEATDGFHLNDQGIQKLVEVSQIDL